VTSSTATSAATSPAASTAAAPEAGGPSRVLQSVVLPQDRDADVLPLYVELGLPGATTATPGSTASPAAVGQVAEQHPENVVDRRQLVVQAGTRASFATYFNAFPASYWRRWTVVEQIELRVVVEGPSTVAVYRSTAAGNSERVTSAASEEGDRRELAFRLPLNRFADGGWYWFDVVAGRDEARLVRAEWVAVGVDGGDDRLAEPPGTVSLGITTYNRPTYLLDMLRQLQTAPEVLEVVDEVLVIDQGTDKVVAQDDADEVLAPLAGKVRIIDQPNVGGSGGFARGMFETLQAGRSRYVLLIDDDVAVEPECVLRGVTFADLCRQPTIVGGHMFNLVAPTHLHSFGEVVRRWRFHWGPADNVWEDHDFAASGLRSTPWMHRRIDVDYNAWWMCLIPVEVLKSIGLSLPLFIKWDDAEFGLRAGEAGFPTVSLPGMAVWHMPWTEKDDTLDWQAYFHLRNKLVAALLHSPFPRGGKVVRESATHTAKHLVAMQYSAARLRIKAIEDVLSGPEHLHRSLATVLPEVRALRAQFPDAQASKEVDAFPAPRRRRPPRHDRAPQAPRGIRQVLVRGAVGIVRQALPVTPEAEERPEASVPAMDAKWWRLSQLDSAVVSTADGTSASWYRRDRETFRELTARSVDLHRRLLAAWPELSRQYAEAFEEVVSTEAWAATFTRLDAEQSAT
jgi:galactofuranosylgalactofuranosylrhamnosyl-N-acetylglucosaminyl-diphospho-decaprenol beta-1,5/1,6-galactofuranosyltransferase